MRFKATVVTTGRSDTLDLVLMEAATWELDALLALAVELAELIPSRGNGYTRGLAIQALNAAREAVKTATTSAPGEVVKAATSEPG